MVNLQEVLLRDAILDLAGILQAKYPPPAPLPPDLDDLVRLCTAYLHEDRKAVGVYLAKHFFLRNFPN